jgi:hypothetical protein
MSAPAVSFPASVSCQTALQRTAAIRRDNACNALIFLKPIVRFIHLIVSSRLTPEWPPRVNPSKNAVVFRWHVSCCALPAVAAAQQ